MFPILCSLYTRVYSCTYCKLCTLHGTNAFCIVCACGTVVPSWWRHQMETFSALLVICAGNSPVPGELLAQRPVTRSFDVFFDLRLNKRLRKQWRGWWFETPSRPLWRQCNDFMTCSYSEHPISIKSWEMYFWIIFYKLSSKANILIWKIQNNYVTTVNIMTMTS